MLNKRTKMKIIFGLIAATLAFTVSIPDSGSISLTSSAMANEGGGGGGSDDVFGGGGSSFFSENQTTAKVKRCKSSAYTRATAVKFCTKKLGKAAKCRGKPRRWICT